MSDAGREREGEEARRMPCALRGGGVVVFLKRKRARSTACAELLWRVCVLQVADDEAQVRLMRHAEGFKKKELKREEEAECD